MIQTELEFSYGFIIKTSRCGETVFESDAPVSIEFDVKRGHGRVVTSGPVTLGLCGETLWRQRVGEKVHKARFYPERPVL